MHIILKIYLIKDSFSKLILLRRFFYFSIIFIVVLNKKLLQPDKFSNEYDTIIIEVIKGEVTMLFLLILIILLSIYIIKSQNIKNAIKKDIEKIIPDNQHNKPQSEQHNNYNREISRKKPVYEPNQDKQSQQTDTKAKDIITEIKTIFLNIVGALKSDYYKLKNSIKEYFKEISVGKDVKHVEKTVYNGPQYNQQYQHNNNPSQCRSKWEEIEDKIMSVSTYILAAIISLCGSMIGNASLYYFIPEIVINSQSPYEVLYNTFIYGKSYEYAINEASNQIINFIYGIGIVASIVTLILSGYFYIKNKDDTHKKRFLIVIIVVFNVFLGTFISNEILYSEMGL